MGKIKASLFGIYKKIIKIFSGYGLTNIFLIRAIHNFISLRLKSGFAVINGHKMFLDNKDPLSLSVEKEYEPLATRIVSKIIKPGDAILDLGANIGYYTLLFAKMAGINGKVYAFEPEPEIFGILKKNVNENGYKNVILEQKAVSDKNTTGKLYLRADNRGDNRIYDSRDGREFIDIGLIRLDDYFSDNKIKIDFIKMDIQGAEILALSGMRRLLTENNPVIMMEFWPIGIKRSGGEPKECLNILRSYGYDYYFLSEDEAGLKKIANEKLLKNYTLENKRYANLLCVKNINKNNIINELLLR